MKKEAIIITDLTLEKFAFPAVGTYRIKSDSGDIIITISERISKYGSGKQTVFSGKWEGAKSGELVRKPIGIWKNAFGAVINHRDGFSSTVKVLTEDQIAKAVTDYKTKLLGTLESLNKLIVKVDENFPTVVIDITTLCNTLNAALVERNETAKAEKEKADKADKERKDKAERRELAKKVTEFDDLQKALLDAIANKDFAKVAELTAQMQTA